MNQNIQSQNVPLYNNNYNMNQNVDYLGGQGEQQNRHGYNSYDQGSFPRQTVNTKEKGERKKSRSRASEEPPKVLPVGQGCHTTYLGAELGVFIAGKENFVQKPVSSLLLILFECRGLSEEWEEGALAAPRQAWQAQDRGAAGHGGAQKVRVIVRQI